MRRWYSWIRQPRFSNWLGNLAVLAGICLIGWLGHTYHWTIPGVADHGHATDEIRTSASPSPAKSRPVSRATSNPSQSPGDTSAPAGHGEDPLPAVEFDTAEAAARCGVETGLVDQRPMEGYVRANGVVGYDQIHLAQLAVRVPGVVWQVEKRLGDLVQPGDVLVIVDSPAVGEAKAALLAATVDCKLKTQALERFEKIQDVVAQRDLMEARAAQEVARTEMFNALQTLVSMGFSLELDEIMPLATDELSQRLRRLGMSDEIAAHTKSANLIPLVAPFAGVVTSCDIVRGETVDPTHPQYVIADISRVWINLDVRQEDASRLRIGAAVEFFGEDGLPPVRCKLTWIGTEIDPRTRTIQARAEGDNPRIDPSQPDYESRRRLQVGAFGTVLVRLTSNPLALTVPNDALRWQWEIGREVVFLPSEGGRLFTPRIVIKGLVRDGYVEILAGLERGDRVVTAGSRVLSSELSAALERMQDTPALTRSFNPAGAVRVPPAAPAAAFGE